MTWRIIVLLGIVLAGCSSQLDDRVATGEVVSTEQTPAEGIEPADVGAVAAQATTEEQLASDVPALVQCSDLPEIETSVEGQLGGRTNPDDLLMGVLFTYAAEHPETFAGIWIDRDSAGTIVVAFIDDPEPHKAELNSRSPLVTDTQVVEPAIPITDPRPLGERDDFVFDVVKAEFTEAELSRVQADLSSLFEIEGGGVQSTGSNTIRNRVSIELFDPTPEGLQAVEQAIAGLPVCGTVTYSPEPPSGPLQIIPEPGQPLVFPPGLSAVAWQLDPEFPAPEPADTTIHVLATELGCASGREMGEALRGPEVRESESEVTIAFAVVPIPGFSDCPGNPSTPVAVTLEAPLGDRVLRDVVDIHDEADDYPGVVLPPVDQPEAGDGWTIVSNSWATESWSPPQWAGTRGDFWEIVDTFWDQPLAPGDIGFANRVALAWTVPVAAGDCGAHVLNDITIADSQIIPVFASELIPGADCGDQHQVFVLAIDRDALPETAIFTDPVRSDVSIEIRR